MLTTKEIATVRNAAKRDGVRKVAKKLSVDRVTLFRVLSEVAPVREKTVDHIRSKLGAL